MAGGGGCSNTTHALLSPDPETLPIGERVAPSHRPVSGNQVGSRPTNGPQAVVTHAPLTAGSNSTLSLRYGPAIIPWELVAENGLFQPKRILAQISPKVTPRPDLPEVGTKQLTLCPSGTNSSEPSPNLVPSEVPASGHHGFIKWGHDAKITTIGVIPTRGSPSQGKANASQDRRQDLRSISECTT